MIGIKDYKHLIGSYFKYPSFCKEGFLHSAKLEQIDYDDHTATLKTDWGEYVNRDLDDIIPMLQGFDDLDIEMVRDILNDVVEYPSEVVFPENHRIEFSKKTENFIKVFVVDEDGENAYSIFLEKGFKIEIHSHQNGDVCTPQNWGRLMFTLMERGFAVI